MCKAENYVHIECFTVNCKTIKSLEGNLISVSNSGTCLINLDLHFKFVMKARLKRDPFSTEGVCFVDSPTKLWANTLTNMAKIMENFTQEE